jgi:hypothetical protein
MSAHQNYNAHAPRARGNSYGRGINGGVGNRADIWPGNPFQGTNLGYLNGQPAMGGGAVAPGSSTMPGSSGHNRTERVRIRTLLDLVYENWIPFTTWLTSRFIGPQQPANPWESPVSFHGAGEVITRMGPYPSGERPFPYPYMIGAVSGFMPMLDQWSMAWAWGKTPSGPGVLTPVPIPWDAQYPQLPKVSG